MDKRPSTETEYYVVDHIVALCGNDHLNLKAYKTNKTTMDLWRSRNNLNTKSILGEVVEVGEDFRYIVAYLDNRQNWEMQH